MMFGSQDREQSETTCICGFKISTVFYILKEGVKTFFLSKAKQFLKKFFFLLKRT